MAIKDNSDMPCVADEMVAATQHLLAQPRFRLLSNEHAFDIAIAICDRIHRPYGIYLPHGDVLRAHRARRGRNEAIRAAFNGRNLDDLATQHNLSVRQVRRILQA